jgi:GT2 family glycosyltransferase
MAGANLSYKRVLFERYGPFLEGTYCSDTEFHWRLARDGLRVRFEPEIRVSHCNIDRLGKFLAHEFEHGRSFGRVHLQAKGFSKWTRTAKVVGAPLCPLRMLSGIVGHNLRNRTYARQFVAALPLVVLGVLAWSLGQVMSYAWR